MLHANVFSNDETSKVFNCQHNKLSDLPNYSRCGKCKKEVKRCKICGWSVCGKVCSIKFQNMLNKPHEEHGTEIDADGYRRSYNVKKLPLRLDIHEYNFEKYKKKKELYSKNLELYQRVSKEKNFLEEYKEKWIAFWISEKELGYKVEIFESECHVEWKGLDIAVKTKCGHLTFRSYYYIN